MGGTNGHPPSNKCLDRKQGSETKHVIPLRILPAGKEFKTMSLVQDFRFPRQTTLAKINASRQGILWPSRKLFGKIS